MKEKQIKRQIYALKVRREKLQETIDKLKEKGKYDNTFEILKEKNDFWLPLKEKAPKAKKKYLIEKQDHQTLLEKFGIKSYEIIGEIIILFLPEELEERKEEVGKFLLEKYPKVKAVYREKGKTEGKYRIQEKELIAGEEESETMHKENNLKFKLDITKVFFSSRQNSERLRLSDKVKEGDTICVLFSGIGAIPVYLSHYTNARKITAIEINEVAHEYAKENLQLNKIDNVELIHGDINEILPEMVSEKKFDLIIMPLPKDAPSYINLVTKALKKEGRLIQFLVGGKQKKNEKIKELQKEGFRILKVRKERSTGSREWRYTIYARKNRNLN